MTPTSVRLPLRFRTASTPTSSEPPRSAEAIDENAALFYGKVFHALLERGIALAPSAYEVGFLSLAHTREHVDRLADTLTEVLDEIFSETGSWKMELATNELTGSES